MASCGSDSSDNDSVKSYASVVRGNSSPLQNTWWRRFQEEDEEQAVAIATKRSVEEQQVIYQFTALRWTNVLCRYELVVILFQSDASGEVLCVTTAGFGGDVGLKRLTDEENCVEVSINHVHNRLY